MSFATNAYVAELAALTSAVKFAFDLVKLNSFQHGQVPQVYFHHDATTVGRQADGSWQCLSQPRLGHLSRSLVQLVETRFGLTLALPFIMYLDMQENLAMTWLTFLQMWRVLMRAYSLR